MQTARELRVQLIIPHPYENGDPVTHVLSYAYMDSHLRGSEDETDSVVFSDRLIELEYSVELIASTKFEPCNGYASRLYLISNVI